MTKRLSLCSGGVILLAAAVSAPASHPTDLLAQGFENPPRQARMHCYWWWLNGNTTKATIIHDLEEMKAKGYGGVLLVDANGSDQGGNRNVPAGPTFASPEWRQLYLHALREAARLNLEISLNIQSGWNLGGPTVKPEEASKVLTFARMVVEGPANVNQLLAEPAKKNGLYEDVAVLLYPLHAGHSLPGHDGDPRRPIHLLIEKAAFKEVGPFSMPVTVQLLKDDGSQSDKADTAVREVNDVTGQMRNGVLKCSVPAGTWEVLRIGYTDSGATVSTSSGQWQGLAIDYMDHTAFQSYWNQNVMPLLRDARSYIGNTLRYLVTDSWELGGTNWTSRFREEFHTRRGYDLLPYLPVISGRIVESRDASNRFLNDFRRTIGDLIANEHYRVFAESASREGLGIHPESGGPHGAPIDALQTLGMSTFPQTEFWAKSETHRSADQDRFFVKEASSAAHIYGKTLVAQEGMTSIGPQWEETIWSDLKSTFDQAVCSGLNLLFWHTFTSSPAKYGVPGEEYFAGTHLNPNVTWWPLAAPFIGYINRTQFLMQQGHPVSDVLYYYGSYVPDFVRLKAEDPAKVLPGYDYDVTDEDVLLHRAGVRNGEIILPGGVAYRVLALDNSGMISLASLRKLRDLVSGGATVVGDKPQRTIGLQAGKVDDTEVTQIASSMWGNCSENGVTEHAFGGGRVYCGVTSREVLQRLRMPPDFEALRTEARFDYTHRTMDGAEIYFVRNESAEPAFSTLTFRVEGKQPEIWDPATGEVEEQSVYSETNGHRTTIPVWFEPYGSIFVVFRRNPKEHVTAVAFNGENVFGADAVVNPPKLTIERQNQRWRIKTLVPGHYEMRLSDGTKLGATVQASETSLRIDGPWAVNFPAGWGAPANEKFNALESWTLNANPGVRFFSGTATYSKQIDVPPGMLRSSADLLLDLGDVREIGQVSLNGRDLGIAWKKPFVLRLKGAKPGLNDLQVRVTNLWPNRLIGDQALPPDKRFTHTNITKFRADSPLLPSGLLGPVQIVAVKEATFKITREGESGPRTVAGSQKR